MWIVVKILDTTLAWTLNGWGSHHDAVRFKNKNYMLPNGGKWVKDTQSDEPEWSEANLITA